MSLSANDAVAQWLITMPRENAMRGFSRLAVSLRGLTRQFVPSQSFLDAWHKRVHARP